MRSVDIPESVLSGLWDVVEKKIVVVGDCWEWPGRLTYNGYAKVKCRVGGKERTYYVHRVSWVWHYGQIEPGFVLDHLCRNRACVFPGHLEPVSQRENVLRGYGATAVNANKTHCDSGHEYTEHNTLWVRTKYGMGRNCRACITLREKRESLKRWKAKVAALEAELSLHGMC